MQQYLDLLNHIITNGAYRDDRTGTGTLSVFGYQMRFDLSKGFPLLTTKRIYTKSVIAELLWFLSGSTNIHDLHKLDVHIWDEWADEDGELGPIYGKQWREWADGDDDSVDQIYRLVNGIKKNPNSRRHVVVAYNPAEVESMALPPCHAMFQMYVANNRLSCQLYQRSADVFLGLPFNIASYSLLTHMVAQQCDLEVGEFIWTGGDTHLYLNHMDQVNEQLQRTPRKLPELKIVRKPGNIFSYKLNDFIFLDYNPCSSIKADIAV